MRLTLRTMLAYMDGILEPEDAEDIRKKIEESEYATNLLHRTRDVMRRLRLAAPGLTDGTQQLDANTVAEYLDNTLHDERVTDFEKVCLDSDVQLAEVSSCHQILTLVLGEPAEIDPDARERMYRLVEQLVAESEAEKQTAAADDAAKTSGDGKPADEPEKTKTRQKPTVPEYLRDRPPRRRLWPIAVAVAATVGFVLAVLIAFGQLEPGTFLGDMLAGKPAERQIAQRPDELKPPVVEQPLIEDTSIPTPSDTTPSDTEPPGVNVLRVEPSGEESALPETTETTETVEPPGGPVEPPPAAPEMPEDDTPDAAATPDVPADELVIEPPADSTQPPAAEPTPKQPMGHFTSGDQVLLRLDTDTGAWQRVAADQVVTSGQRLLALPAYRPLITLGNGVAVELIDGTEIELVPPDADDTPGMKIAFGRAILRAVDKPNCRLRLLFGNHGGTVVLADAESVSAVDVNRLRLPGTNPETEPAPTTASLYAVSGKVLWEEAGRESVTVAPENYLMICEQPAVAGAVKELPEWINSAALSTWDELAAPVLERSIGPDRSADLSLIELADHRRKEVSWLAARCLGYMDQPESMVVVLNEPEGRQIWPRCIEQLCSAVHRGPKTAAAVRQAMQRQYGQDAAGIYRMLWGYTQNDLEAGHAARLVGYLDHDTLAARVLSFWNLKEITGWGLFYKPEQTAAKRKTAVQKWTERLDSGEIKVKREE